MTGAFVEVNCATIRGDAAMSTLFGHVRGSFTGALRDRPGLLRAADGGVLFLDEVGELGPDEQAALLRAIEEKQFLPLGADREARSDFQLIAGTNADLAAAVRAGRFREDLLARINLWTFRLPGLAERAEDVEPNLDHELTACSAVTGMRVSMSREARERFLAFATSPEARVAGQLPRLQRRDPADGDARAGRTDHARQRSTRRSAGSGAAWQGRPRARPTAVVARDGADSRAARRTSTTSIARSSKKWCASARTLGVVCRNRAGGCLPRRGRARPRQTMPTGCGSISRGSVWTGKRCVRARRISPSNHVGGVSVRSNSPTLCPILADQRTVGYFHSSELWGWIVTAVAGSARGHVLAYVFVLAAITYLDRICISAAAPFIMADLGLSVLEMSVVFSAFTLGYSLFEVRPAGWATSWGRGACSHASC